MGKILMKVEMVVSSDIIPCVNGSIQKFFDNCDIIEIDTEEITKENYKNLSIFNNEVDLGDWKELLKGGY